MTYIFSKGMKTNFQPGIFFQKCRIKIFNPWNRTISC